jgi:hypothetical protein
VYGCAGDEDRHALYANQRNACGEDTAGLRVAEAEVGLDVISDGELVKTSFLAYAEARLTGFVPITANDPYALLST